MIRLPVMSRGEDALHDGSQDVARPGLVSLNQSLRSLSHELRQGFRIKGLVERNRLPYVAGQFDWEAAVDGDERQVSLAVGPLPEG